MCVEEVQFFHTEDVNIRQVTRVREIHQRVLKLERQDFDEKISLIVRDSSKGAKTRR